MSIFGTVQSILIGFVDNLTAALYFNVSENRLKTILYYPN